MLFYNHWNADLRELSNCGEQLQVHHIRIWDTYLLHVANIMTAKCVLSYMTDKADQLVVCVRKFHACIQKIEDGISEWHSFEKIRTRASWVCPHLCHWLFLDFISVIKKPINSSFNAPIALLQTMLCLLCWKSHIAQVLNRRLVNCLVCEGQFKSNSMIHAIILMSGFRNTYLLLRRYCHPGGTPSQAQDLHAHRNYWEFSCRQRDLYIFSQEFTFITSC